MIDVSYQTIGVGRSESASDSHHNLCLMLHPTAYDKLTTFAVKPYAVPRSFTIFGRSGGGCTIEMKTAPAKVLLATIENERCAGFLDGANLSSRHMPQLFEQEDCVLLNLVSSLLKIQATLGADALETEALGEAILRHILRTCLPDDSRVAALSPPAVARVIDYVSANLANAICLDDMAALAGTSRFEFARSFARAVGVPPHRYVMLRRVREALTRIRTGDIPLADVAAAHGFCDQSHMNRWVRRELGMAPARLRASGQVGGSPSSDQTVPTSSH